MQNEQTIENLFHAVKRGDLTQVRQYLDAGMDVNVRNSPRSRSTPGLVWAVGTPLIWAAGRGHMDIVRLLLSHGADSHAKDHAGQTAATWAAVMGHRAIVELLRAAGAEISLLEAAAIGDTQTTRHLLDQGADANRSFPDQTTVLFYAARNGQAETVRLLLNRGADLEPGDDYGTALAHAASRGHVETVHVLLEAGANPNEKTLGGPMLVIAASDGYTEIVRLLLEYGADIHARGGKYGDLYKKTALQVAQERGHLDLVKLLKQAGAKK